MDIFLDFLQFSVILCAIFYLRTQFIAWRMLFDYDESVVKEELSDLVLIARKIEAPKEIKNKCKELTPAYLYIRYPDVVTITNIREVAERLVEHAQGIVLWVEENI